MEIKNLEYELKLDNKTFEEMRRGIGYRSFEMRFENNTPIVDLRVNKESKEYEKALIGRDILSDFKLIIDFKGREIEFEDC